jgi:hypothetical protein
MRLNHPSGWLAALSILIALGCSGVPEAPVAPVAPPAPAPAPIATPAAPASRTPASVPAQPAPEPPAGRRSVESSVPGPCRPGTWKCHENRTYECFQNAWYLREDCGPRHICNDAGTPAVCYDRDQR